MTLAAVLTPLRLICVIGTFSVSNDLKTMIFTQCQQRTRLPDPQLRTKMHFSILMTISIVRYQKYQIFKRYFNVFYFIRKMIIYFLHPVATVLVKDAQSSLPNDIRFVSVVTTYVTQRSNNIVATL